MAETEINNAVRSDLANQVKDYSVDSATIDSAEGNKETEWINSEWNKQYGYYKKIPELKCAIDAKATWTIGKGFEASPLTTFILRTIKGFGRDTFNTILENMIRTYHICGDAFAEVIRDTDDKLLNIKPLNPREIKIIANEKGKIIRYEQIKSKKKPEKFKPHEIFHMARNRIANEIHGQSIIPQVENIILMRNEAMNDWKRVLHRNIDPLWIFHLDTDDPSKIATFKGKMDKSRGKGENMYIPKGAVVPEQVGTAQNSTLNPLAWIERLNNYFYQAVRVPQIIVGGSSEYTEATAKIAYLAFQQTIEEEQLYIEEEVGEQLGLDIDLKFPASLENEVLSDESKDGDEKIKSSETTAGEGQ